MNLSSTLITAFQELHLKTFGEAILPEATELELLSLAELVKITQPMTDKENDDEK